MNVKAVKKSKFFRGLSLFLCIAVFITGIPFQANAATKVKKFIKANPQVFVGSEGEKAKITWNYETDHIFNIKVMDGDMVIDYLAKDKKYKGNYETHEITWDGKDDSGKLVGEGTYTIVVEPQEAAYKKYKSSTNITVLNSNSKEIGIATKLSGNTFKVYGKGGTKQGVSKVTLSVTKDGDSSSSINAIIEDNLWHANLPMSAYSLYNVKATIKSSSGTTTETISAIRHIFRVSDRLTYLGSAYYGDYTKDQKIIDNNNLSNSNDNQGKLVGKNILIINPSQKVQQGIKKDSTTIRQHLGVIDQLQRTASTNPVSLSMGNNFYQNDDISIDGYLPLTFGRSYNSLSHNFNEFGFNWTNSFTYYLQDMGNLVAIQFPDGHTEYYTKQSDGTYKATDGLVRKLKVNSDKSYTLTIDGTQVFVFDKDGSLKTIKDLNDNKTVLTYTNGMLTKVENISGYFKFTYNTDGTLKSVKDNGDRSISYSYKDGLVNSFIDVNGNETTYDYDSTNRLNKVVSPENVSLLKVKYDSSDRVISKSVQESTYTYSYDDSGRTITCTEPNGNIIKFHYTKDYRIESEEYSDGTVKYYYKDKSDKAKSANVSSKSKQKTDSVVKLSTKDKTDNEEEKLVKLSGQSEKSVDLSLKTHNMNTATGNETNNTLYPQFLIKNNGSSTVDLSRITLRYYYTIDGEKPQNFWCDWSSAGTGNVTGKFVKLNTPTSTADYYLEVGFTSGAGELKPGKTVETHIRIAKNDWSNFIPGNDYSQNTESNFTSFDKVDMFYDGTQVWGKGSLGSGEDNSSNQDNEPNQENETDKNKENTNNTNQDKPTGTNQLKLQMYNTGNSGTSNNTIHPMMRLINTGENMVKLSDITIRYYYTADDDKPQNFWCDWSSVGQQNITGTFHSMKQTSQGADTYLEVGFKSGSDYIDIGGQVDIHVRIAKNDWSNYDITNDYSLRPAESFADWKKVDVFVKEEKVWGEGVVPSEVEESTEEHIEYADTTYTPVRAEMYNTKTESTINFLAPRFRIYNTDTEAIKLSDLNILYFYTTDGPEEQIFEADWAGIGGKYQTSIGKEDISCEFTEVGDDNLNTNCAANITINRDDLKLEPGEYIELHTRIHRVSWTNYVQSNDFSLNSESTSYEEWNKIAIFVSDKWAFGSLPMTYAQVTDPDPESNYPVDTQSSYGSNTDKAGNATYYSYDENGNITSCVDAMGNKTEYTYNTFNQITSIIDALGNKTIYDYDNKGNRISVTDALGNKTKYTYNTLGCLTKIENPDGSSESRTYDSSGNMLTATDANNNTVTYQYNTLNRVTKNTDGNGNSESYEYTDDGQINKVIDALGYTTKTEYNKDGQVVKETNQNGKSTQFKYNAITGRLSQVIDALSGVEEYQYDNMGNLTVETAADGSKTTYEYDLYGRIKSVTDREGGKTTYTVDENGNVIQEKNALGDITKYTYDKLNRITSVTDGENRTTSYRYDALSRITDETKANGGVTSYDYDAVGNLTKMTDALGNVTKQEYNKLGLLTTIIDGEGNKTTM